MKNYESIKNYLLVHDDELVEVVQVINCYNSSLDFLDYWDNDEEFFNTFFFNNPMELARAIYYGDYNYCDEYVKFNGYGNLETTDRYGLVKKCKYYIDEIVTELLKVYEEIEVSEELKEILED